MTVSATPSPLVRATLRLEDAEGLDGPVRTIEPLIRDAFGSGARGAALRGDWLGHALHPVLTDAALGTWTSATLLDLTAGPGSADAARRLVGFGLLAAGPTAWTGWAQWVQAGPREQRVGLVHAVASGVGIGLYAASWVARRRGSRAAGTGLALAGAAALSVSGYLGGHLATVRGVSSHDPAFDDDTAAVPEI